MLTAIGQGDTLVTPMHLAMLMSAIANDGVLMTPRVLDRTENYTGTLVERYEPQEYGSLLTSEESRKSERISPGSGDRRNGKCASDGLIYGLWKNWYCGVLQ